MKKLMFSLFILSLSQFSLMAGEFPKGSIQLDNIRYIVTNNSLLDYNGLDHIDFKIPSAASSLSDVRTFESFPEKVKSSEIKALIID